MYLNDQLMYLDLEKVVDNDVIVADYSLERIQDAERERSSACIG
ncbi:hypothetical protein HRED_09967 [Candidatus Haloredivivus sp. G17]|nr:hypothetical protein HRED_09967 [Candidatus Haloredivivus sp. G17]